MGGQKTLDGYYKLDKMFSAWAAHGGRIGCCGTCMNARGITDALLTGAAERFTWKTLPTGPSQQRNFWSFNRMKISRTADTAYSSPSPPVGVSKAFPLPIPSFKPLSQVRLTVWGRSADDF